MMKKIFYTFFFCAVSFLNAQTQKDSTLTNAHLKQKGFFIGGRLTEQRFQDSRYTDLIYRGMNYGFEAGYKYQSEKYIWQAGVNNFAGKINTTVGKPYSTVEINLYFTYLQNIFHKQKTHFYVGARLDLLDAYSRSLEKEEGKNSELINNSGGYIIGWGQFAISGLLMYDFNKVWQWQSRLDFQLFGVMKQSPSFGTSTPQYYLSKKTFENPEGDFLDGAFQPFYKYINLSLSQKIFYKQRYSFAYEWVLKQSMEVVGYPVTRGGHFLTLGIQF